MNIKELTYVKCIADSKSISKAAQKLYIAQPSLSQALQKIEDDIGTPLFIRKSRGMELTLAGEKYYITAKEIINMYDDFINEVSYINNYEKGRLNIGIASFLGTFLLPKILPEFSKKYSNIEIYIEEHSTAVLEQMIREGNIDFGIMHSHPKLIGNGIDYEILHEDPFVVITEKGHELEKYAHSKNGIQMVPISELQRFDYIVVDKDKGIRKICNIMWNEANIVPNIVLTSKNFETAKRLAINGLGITIIPKKYSNLFSCPEDYNSFEISGTNNAYWNTSILTRPNTYVSKISTVFIEQVRKYYESFQENI